MAIAYCVILRANIITRTASFIVVCSRWSCLLVGMVQWIVGRPAAHSLVYRGHEVAPLLSRTHTHTISIIRITLRLTYPPPRYISVHSWTKDCTVNDSDTHFHKSAEPAYCIFSLTYTSGHGLGGLLDTQNYKKLKKINRKPSRLIKLHRTRKNEIEGWFQSGLFWFPIAIKTASGLYKWIISELFVDSYLHYGSYIVMEPMPDPVCGYGN